MVWALALLCSDSITLFYRFYSFCIFIFFYRSIFYIPFM